ncbi:MAG: hypothetical protein GF398_16045 [Chitinivibrionales bacterium]|nr:hypothetical protein [Chitinivibrionales bacterium]
MTRALKFCRVAVIVGSVVSNCTNTAISKGNSCLKLGDYHQAQVFFGKSLMRDPDDYYARLGMGKALLQQAVAESQDTSVWRKALIHLEASRTLRPRTFDIALLGQAWREAGRTRLSVADTVGGLQAYSRGLHYQPLDLGLINSIAIIYHASGYPQKAEVLFRKALRIDSTHAHTYFNLGMVFWQAGKKTLAHEQWLKALNFDAEDEDILYWFSLAERARRARQ